MVNFEVFGLKEMQQHLEAMGDKASGELLEKAALAGADIVKKEAGTRAPRRRGLLAGHIVLQPGDKGKMSASALVGPDKKRFYGRFVELGTSKMAAEPFLFPAFESKKDEVQRKMAELIREGLGL